MHRNPETLTAFFSSGMKLLLPSLVFSFSTQGERERDTIFTMPTVPSDPTTHGASQRPHFTGLAQVQKSTCFVQRQISTHWPSKCVCTPQSQLDLPSFGSQLTSSRFKSQLCFFSKITQNPQPIASGHDVIDIPRPISYLGFLLWHLWLSDPSRACVNTFFYVCTYPCTKLKSSKPNETER